MVRSSMFGHCCLIEFLFLNFDQKEIRTHGRFVYVMILSLLSDLLIAESLENKPGPHKKRVEGRKKGNDYFGAFTGTFIQMADEKSRDC